MIVLAVLDLQQQLGAERRSVLDVVMIVSQGVLLSYRTEMLFVFGPCLSCVALAHLSAVACCVSLFYLLVLLFVDKKQPTVSFLKLRDLVC